MEKVPSDRVTPSGSESYADKINDTRRYLDTHYPLSTYPEQPHFSIDRDDDRVCSAIIDFESDVQVDCKSIRTEKINKYKLIEATSKQFSSRVSDSTTLDPGVAIIVEEGGDMKVANIFEGNNDASIVYARESDWEKKYGYGWSLLSKTVRSWGGGPGRGNHRSGTVTRYKIDRSILDKADNVYVVEYYYSRGSSENNSHIKIRIEDAYRLQRED